ncbi:MAG: phosphoribosylanthranilate isomerase [Coriobacteriia bacterium]|nr:phosphoribosylanthranilate isomerase [Coriobacteriia bacterium]GAV30971.1 n-(5'-phosphoribosyl)anthranilate isomerase [Coriobacteriaceae bacterium EMTCatB1]
MRTRVKICGIRNEADAALAVAAGADALGVVLAESPRQVTLEQARRALRAVPPFVARVGVFVDAEQDLVAEAARVLGLSAVQFHGDETPEECASAPLPVVKAFRIGGVEDLAGIDAYRGSVAAVLLDARVPGARGGTGVPFDWEAVRGALPTWVPVVVAGGLCADNVRAAVRTLRPYAVDVSSGVEAAPGVKDATKVEQFMAAVRAADEER